MCSEVDAEMDLNNRQGSGCSSRSRSQNSWARIPNRGRVCKTSGQRWCGLFAWADEEEDESMNGKALCENSLDQAKMNLGFRVSKVEAEIRVIKCWGLGLIIVMLVVLFGNVWNGLGIRK
ncbi:hypothetical protein PIB30_034008 [Stylosanthes scabra]|uniref:Uncharacterized protein n=1 Tax=Stylosanthes scabra TaxID=79078 RepID=A0ABU6VEL9_9FABA|nr:hypothetical protein [Stylosanthes scabra]